MVEKIFSEIPAYKGVGVYSIKTATGEIYIGSSCNVYRRLYQHASKLLRGEGQPELQKLMPDGLPFKAEVVCKLPDTATWYDLNEAESDCIQRGKAAGNCINIAPCRKQRKSDIELLNSSIPGTPFFFHNKRLVEERNAPVVTIKKSRHCRRRADNA